MIKQPEHRVGPAFEKAREWAADQERKLTDDQRRAYDALRKKQALERQQQQERLDAFRSQLEEQAKKRRLKAELVLNPPIKTADPYVRRQAQNIIAAEKRLEQLDHRHADERLKALREFEQQRERQKSKPAKELTDSWKDALQKTARQEANKDRDLSRDFDKSR